MQRLGIAILLFLSLIFLGVSYLLLTTEGSSFVVRTILSSQGQSKNVTFNAVRGNLVEGLVYQAIGVKNVRGLPVESALTIQQLQAGFHWRTPDKIWVEVHNGRLLFPRAEYPILFGGRYSKRMLDLNVYFNEVDARDILDLISRENILRFFSGALSDSDIYIRGPLDAPELTGQVEIKKLSYREFSIIECPVSFQLRFEDWRKKLRLFGELQFHSGILASRNAQVQLGESAFSFTGNPKNPQLHIKGTSTIEGIRISLILEGTFDNPKLSLGSDPPLSEGELLLMLSTGKRWRGIEPGVTQGQIPLSFAKDFVDDFASRGSGSRIAERFGLESVFLTYDTHTGGIGVTKSVSDKAELSYGFEKPTTQEIGEQPGSTQKLGAEYKVTDTLSIKAEQDTQRQDVESGLTKEEYRQDSKLWLKYKKKF